MPETSAGRMLAEFVGQLGSLLLVVPLLIVAAEYGRLKQLELRARVGGLHPCAKCATFDHAVDARFCKACGTPLPKAAAPTA